MQKQKFIVSHKLQYPLRNTYNKPDLKQNYTCIEKSKRKRS